VVGIDIKAVNILSEPQKINYVAKLKKKTVLQIYHQIPSNMGERINKGADARSPFYFSNQSMEERRPAIHTESPSSNTKSLSGLV